MLERFNNFHLSDLIVASPVKERRQRSQVVSAENDIDPRRLAQHRVFVFLSQAATYRNLHVGIVPLAWRQVAEVTVEPVISVLTNSAGVENHHIGVSNICFVSRPLVTGGLKQTRQPLRIMNVHLTAVGADLISACRSSRSIIRHACVTRHHRSHGAIVRRPGPTELTRSLIRPGAALVRLQARRQPPRIWWSGCIHGGLASPSVGDSPVRRPR